ncbi:sensor domain-containing diguanylate cyclase [Faecalispora anaeroviscerum]|uniref:sensor domain-containing diguanylate cyclase n=1 Tax=Faecalispora anaeroviscerum TaxID=2991836 RepID=UPI0024B909EC|nr:sensor domain-containing diguanylate cyclase [Faecalispora anaeroviscerum]
MGFQINEEHYRLIFENSQDAILIMNPKGKTYRANPAACRLFQKTEEELCSSGRAGIVDLGDPKLALEIQDRERVGETRNELTFIKNDGSKFIADYSSTLFLDKDGVQLALISIHDMTTYKQNEASLRRSQEESEFLAMHDYLTGSLNRRSFMELLSAEMNRARWENQPLTLLIADIDYFKNINDTYGHIGGDLVLKKFTECISSNLHAHDFLGRFGGDEFVICFPNTNLTDALTHSEHLRRQVEQLEVYHNSLQIELTASFGVVVYRREFGVDTDRYLAKADDYLYQAKLKRNCVCSEDSEEPE